MASIEQQSVLHFSIGPVQDFIETARTTRDLWTGSYILSWLTARAAAAVLDERGTLVPECLRDAPLVKFHRGQREQDRAHLLSSSLPNTFAFIAPGADGEGLRVAVENAVRAEWKNVADAVHEELNGKFRVLADGAGWDVHWDKQVDHHWDIRVSMLPPLEESAVTAALKATNTHIVGEPPYEPVKRRVALVNALAAADKHIRHYPPHAPEDDRRPKCALTGAESRMGPLAVEANNRFWGQGKDAPKVNAITESHIGGTRLQSKDRLGAVGLIKRYAWACYFAKRLEKWANAMRKPDTATVAAAGWLADGGNERGEICKVIYNPRGYWSGQWLHWSKPDQGGEPGDDCPRDIWTLIQTARNAARDVGDKSPAAYYAVLMLDGDSMGKQFKEASVDDANKLSAALQDFALDEVPEHVKSGIGELIYAGGDDVLAFLPLLIPGNDINDRHSKRTVLDCAAAINKAFGDKIKEGTTSAGLVVAHYKSDLREVLEQARKAEKVAKTAGRNRLCLTVMRRSGEHAGAVVCWGKVLTLSGLVCDFAEGEVTDRWVYQLRQEWETLKTLGADAIDAEVARLLSRSDKRSGGGFWETWEALKGDSVESRANALTLIQSASFIARGKD